MAHKSDFDRFYYFFAVAGVTVLLANLYYYAHPLWRGIGWTHEIADSLMLKLRAGGVFEGVWKTKTLGLALLAACLVSRSGRGVKVPWLGIAAVLVSGLLLFYLAPVGIHIFYVILTLGGAVTACIGFGMVGRSIGSFHEAQNDRNETFAQCERKIDTDVSVNIRTRYQYRGRMHKGWINVVNPFRGTMVLGTPGSGKSYSVYGPFIEQMISKGYAMFVYDYKYPDLTELTYNELLLHQDSYKIKPEFCVINFQDPRYSLRCNPIAPRYITDPADTTEIAELVMLNVNRQAIEKEDFFTLSAKVYLDALIWFLKIYEDGKYCTFPHVIELMAQDYKKVFRILSRYPELEAKIKPFQNALEGNAQDQLQGQIASAQIPLNKFVSKKLYWVLSGDDFTLDINNPEHPKILCVGNDPDRQSIYGTTLALYTSRLFKAINHKHRLKCAVLLDELATIFLKGLDTLIATARSNLVAVVIGFQDYSQLVRDYMEKEAEVIFNTIGNIFAGQVNGKTAQLFSRMLGKEFRRRESQTRGIESDSVNISFQQDEILPESRIETMSQGVFFGKVADNNDEKIEDKFFCGEIQRDRKEVEAVRKHWQPLPRMTDFGEEKIRQEAMANKVTTLTGYFAEQIRRDGSIHYDSEDEIEAAAVEKVYRCIDEGTSDELLKKASDALASDAVERVIQRNFDRIQREVRDIIIKEISRLNQEIKPLPQQAGSTELSAAESAEYVDPFSE